MIPQGPFGIGILDMVYVGMSSLCVRRRMLDKKHPARKFWRAGMMSVAVWWPTRTTLENFERALILTAQTPVNKRYEAPSGLVLWEDPVLVNIFDRHDVPEGPGVYAILWGRYGDQVAHVATDRFVGLFDISEDLRG